MDVIETVNLSMSAKGTYLCTCLRDGHCIIFMQAMSCELMSTVTSKCVLICLVLPSASSD